MTFKGETIIGEPKLKLVETYIAENKLFCDAQECFKYWTSKNWLNQKGKKLSTLELAISSYNNIAIQKFVKKNQTLLGVDKGNKRERRLAKKRARKDILNGNITLKKQERETIQQKNTSIPPTRERIPYDEQLKDKKWLAFRRFVFTVRGKVCEQCGSVNCLQVHHPKYKVGRWAWEYTCNEVVVLCRECHKKAHGIA